MNAVAGDSHKNGETRRSLQPLVDLASSVGAALLGITHFSKGTNGREPIERIIGSIAFGALARVVMVAAKEPEADDGTAGRRILARAKSNIGPDEGGYAYTLESKPMPGHDDIVASVAAWGDAIDGTARDMLAVAEATDDNGEGHAFSEAKVFLLDLLMDGPKACAEIKVEAKNAARSWRTIERAKSALKVTSFKSGDAGTWVWSLPQDQQSSRPNGLADLKPSPTPLADLADLKKPKQNPSITNPQHRQEDQHRQDRQDFKVCGLAVPGVLKGGIEDGWEGEI